MKRIPRSLIQWRFLLALGAVGLAFAILQWVTSRTTPEQIIRILPGQVTDSLPLASIIKGVVEENQTFFDLALSLGVPSRTADLVVRQLSGIVDFRAIVPGQPYLWQLDREGRVLEFRIFRQPWDSFVLRRDTTTGNVTVYRDSVALKTCVTAIKGTVKTSLYEAMTDQLYMPNMNILFQFTDIFESDIDFFTDCREGDRYEILYEEQLYDNAFARYGKILAARYITSGKTYDAYYFEDKEGHKGYYSFDGRSVRKSFLRSPLRFSVVSSHFSHSRFHPILKIFRPHLGVDYSAPAGTPVSSSADGSVSFAGWSGGFGNMVRIKHSGGLESYYGHLSKIGDGIHVGARVERGQTIGYVGSTGLSTGPHLDYRLTEKGKFVNPEKRVAPPGEPIDPRYLTDFQAEGKVLGGGLDVLREGKFALKPVAQMDQAMSKALGEKH